MFKYLTNSIFFHLLSNAMCSTVETQGGKGFCYNDNKCGPYSNQWPAICHNGKRQSPVMLPNTWIPEAKIRRIQLENYKGNFFRMKNNGHSVEIDFVGKTHQNEGPSSHLFSFPDPTYLNIYRQYKFAAVHFHWGVNDYITGSEHCIAGKCSALEIHFVHFLANYPSLKDAVASGNESAIAVLGVLVDVSATKTAGNNLYSILFQKPIMPVSLDCFGPVVKNLRMIQVARPLQYAIAMESLDFSKCITQDRMPLVYSYKGSLTTPGCEEQVNWYVMKHPVTTSHQDLEAFRRILNDKLGKPMSSNHRPIQQLNNRNVKLLMMT